MWENWWDRTNSQRSKSFIHGLPWSLTLTHLHRLHGKASWKDKPLNSTLATKWQLHIHISDFAWADQRCPYIWQGTCSVWCMGHFQIRAVLVHRLSRAALATDCFVDLMVTPGNTGDHSSFCSKAAGQYGLLLTLWSFMEECPVFKSTIMVACNGQCILDCLCSHKPIYPFAAHAHHLCTCQYLVNSLPCTTIFTNVKGCQNDGYLTVLPWEAWLNIEADLLTINRVDPTLPDKTAYLVPFKWWSMVIGTKNCETYKIGDVLIP